jgi:hypothetical protein
MPEIPRGKPPSQRPGRRPGGAHRYRPWVIDGDALDRTYASTESAGRNEPVVFLINADDPIGEKVGREILGPKTFKEIVADYRGSPEAASIYLGIESEDDAIGILSFFFANAATAFDRPKPEDHYRVVVVDAREMTCHSRPIPRSGSSRASR